jgi:hypothetical protein
MPGGVHLTHSEEPATPTMLKPLKSTPWAYPHQLFRYRRGHRDVGWLDLVSG